MSTRSKYDRMPCAIAMGCLCAGHANGLPASEACDTDERWFTREGRKAIRRERDARPDPRQIAIDCGAAPTPETPPALPMPAPVVVPLTFARDPRQGALPLAGLDPVAVQGRLF